MKIKITDIPKKEVFGIINSILSHLAKRETFKLAYEKLSSLKYDNDTGITSLDNGEVYAKHPILLLKRLDLSIPSNIQWWSVHFARLVADEAFKIEKLAKN